MNAEQRQRASQLVRSQTEEEAIGEAFALLQELIDAPEPEPVGYTNETELDYVRKYEALPVSGTFWPTSDEDACVALYTAPPANNQSEQHLEMVNPPAPSVPDEQLQAAFDRGLKAGNEQAIAQQIEIHKLHDSLAAPQPEQPTDLVRDAERYRWLKARAQKDTSYDRFGPDGCHWSIGFYGKSAQSLDAAIDAAMAAEKGGES